MLRLFAIAAYATAISHAEVECRWATSPIVIDGKADERAWLGAAEAGKFRQHWIGQMPRAGATVRLLWDREWLYFFADMEDADVWAEVTEHDGQLWDNDVFELFLRPSQAHAGYYEFQVNPAAAIFDAFFPSANSKDAPDARRTGTFHVEVKVAVRGSLNKRDDRDSGWSVEGRIPWGDLGATGGRPEPDERWTLNLSRYDYTAGMKEPELSAVAPLTKLNFHQTDHYAPVRFIGPQTAPHARWINTRLLGSPDGPPKYRASRAWPELSARPLVTAVAEPGGGRMFFIEQRAADWDSAMTLRAFAPSEPSQAGTLLDFPGFAYSIAFHPRFAENGFLFFGVNEAVADGRRNSRVVRYTMRSGTLDPASREVIIEWSSNGHNGAALAFAADGMLFITSGDGTSDMDADLAGQNTRSLRAKILRIDVDRPADGRPYSVPGDNPFASDARFAPETWAYGLRNPWRMTFDFVSGQLWVGENGQDHREYARLVTRGANYGWSRYEGSREFNREHVLGPHPVTFPTIEHSHAEFRSLSGGVVYRGAKLPELRGAYVYGDFGTGRIWAAKHDGTKLEWQRELADTPFAITNIGVDADGELLVADYGAPPGAPGGGGGAFYRLEPAATIERVPFPVKLSDTLLFSDTATQTPAPGVVPYTVAFPAWHDGAAAQRLLALPGDGRIEITPHKSWLPPDGTVLAQTLTLDGRRIETRILVKQQNDWAGYSYVWNETQTDAVLADKAGADVEIQRADFRQPWRIPSRAECLMCHSRQAGFALSLTEPQLNAPGQLALFESLGLLKSDAPALNRARGVRFAPQAAGQRTPPSSTLLPRDPARMLSFSTDKPEPRARAYLAANCAHCHTLYGGGNSALEFDWQTPREKMNALDARPQHTAFGINGARIVAPGDLGRSILPIRAGSRGEGQMPPVGTRVSDPDGMRILVEWIQSLK
jgi:glucose/arabinose dehydrogenase